MISDRRFRDMPARHAAQELAQLLTIGRQYLATFRPKVCPRCSHVFSLNTRLDMRCPGCASKSEVDDGS